MSVKYIAAGVNTDCEELLKRFAQTQTVRFKEFARLWKEMYFSLIFMGKENAKEQTEFIEECFRIALSYVTSSDSEFQRKVGGLYLLYGFYFKQPLDPKLKIRVKINQWREIQSLLNIAKAEKHLDLYYIIRNLQLHGVFYFVYCTTMLWPGAALVEEGQIDSEKRLKNLMFDLKSFSAEEHLENLEELHSQYERLKNLQESPIIQNLKMAKSDFYMASSRSIKVLLQRYQPSRDNDSDLETTTSSDDEMSTLAARRSRIKTRQFMSQPAVPRNRRHRPTAMATDTSDTSSRKKPKIHTDNSDLDLMLTVEEEHSETVGDKDSTSTSMPVITEKPPDEQL